MLGRKKCCRVAVWLQRFNHRLPFEAKQFPRKQRCGEGLMFILSCYACLEEKLFAKLSASNRAVFCCWRSSELHINAEGPQNERCCTERSHVAFSPQEQRTTQKVSQSGLRTQDSMSPNFWCLSQT